MPPVRIFRVGIIGPPDGVVEISKEEFMFALFEYYFIDPPRKRQIRNAQNGGESFDLVIFELPNPHDKHIGYGIKESFFDNQTGKTFESRYSFFKYGRPEDWETLTGVTIKGE